MPHKIQPQELESRGGVQGGTSRKNVDTDGDLDIFDLEYDEDGRWLKTNDGRPENEWNPEDPFLFVPRKPLDFSLAPCQGVFFWCKHWIDRFCQARYAPPF